MKSHVAKIPEIRPLTPGEVGLLQWLLAHGRDGVSPYRLQLNRATVVSRCTCGCASINLAIDGVNAYTPQAGMIILSDYYYRTPSGNLCGVFASACDGKLAGLELWSVDGAETPSSLPDTTQLFADADDMG